MGGPGRSLTTIHGPAYALVYPLRRHNPEESWFYFSYATNIPTIRALPLKWAPCCCSTYPRPTRPKWGSTFMGKWQVVTFVAILEAENKQKVEEFMSPFAQAGWVEITAGVTCEEVVEGQTCSVGLTMARQDEPYHRVNSDEAAQMLEKDGAVIIDVRGDDEWATGHVKGAIHIPVDDLQSRIDELPRDKTLLFICATGRRAGRACEIAATLGYSSEKLYNVEDGTPTWIEKNHPTSYGENP